jgi:hypothetical protein
MLTLRCGDCIEQRPEFTAGAADQPFGERLDQAQLLGERNEDVRRHEAARRVVPAHQHLDSTDAALLEIDDRLVAQLELVPGQRLAKIVLEGQPVGELGGDPPGEDGMPARRTASEA